MIKVKPVLSSQNSERRILRIVYVENTGGKCWKASAPEEEILEKIKKEKERETLWEAIRKQKDRRYRRFKQKEKERAKRKQVA